MPKCIIDSKEYEFKAGETVIQIADRNGVDIPRFCYHPALTVVAQCRMCAVEVDKMGKLQTACSLPATDGMVVHTKSEKVKQAQASVMEFLLINHPLDCPVCDEAGECQLQDYSFSYGAPDSRYDEMRRTYMDLDMGSVIKKNMNRCIHCTRCIRFCDEVGGYREMVALKRGNSTEIVTVDGAPLQTQYAGNLADICPTGSLTLKDFRFKKRAWFLKKTPSVCEGCSQGCNIEVHQENNVVYRTHPRENMDINKWWICDEGRFLFHYVHSEERVLNPSVRDGTSALEKMDWYDAVEKVSPKIKGKALVLVGSDLTQEEIQAIQQFAASKLQTTAVYHYGTENILKAADDTEEDKILRRTSKTSNLHGAEKLGLKPWKSADHNSGEFDCALVFRGGRAMVLNQLRKCVKGAIVGVGVFNSGAVDSYDAVLPGLSFVEKSGTIVNWQGKEQRLNQSIAPLGESKSITDILQLLR
ncbi:MAG TPA: 2Fe-2S iron-sulfur cluster-binding protein [Oligoflexia bacterium]|nr:2Fe-2S iron-sulfur cluster-binding protein [Oligoflexia bacterium]